MWKKGELVWVNLLRFSDTWIPGRILDPSDPVRVLVSFFGLMEPRYVSKNLLRSFDQDFQNVISDSRMLDRRFRRFLNRALRAHFWNISIGLWCSCQPLIDSPYCDRENSLPWFPPFSDLALCYVRDMAVLLRVTLRSLAKANSASAEILSFRRYSVDFKRSESVYEEIRASAIIPNDGSEESHWYLDFSNEDCMDLSLIDVEKSRDLSLSDPLPEDITSISSSEEEGPVDDVVQICSPNKRNHLTNSDSSSIKPCQHIARTVDHENESHRSNVGKRDLTICLLNTEPHIEDLIEEDTTADHENESCRFNVENGHQVEQTVCFLNSEPHIEDMIEEDTTSVNAPRVSVSEVPPDVMIETHGNITDSDDRAVTSKKQLSFFRDGCNDKANLAKPVTFVVPGACQTLACSVRKNRRNKFGSSTISAKTLNEQSSDKNSFKGIQENCSEDALQSHTVEVGVAPEEQLQDLDAATTVENVRSIGVKRKASRDKESASNSKRKKKTDQQSNTSTDKPLNLHLKKDMQLANPKCLRMKFLSNRQHGYLPTKSELLKRFSVFGKIDASKTEVNAEESSAKVVFLQSIDAVTAYQFARSKKFSLGRCTKVMYRLDPFEENKVPLSPKSVPSPKSCLKSVPSRKSFLKKPGSVDKEEGKRKVKFVMDNTN